MLSRLSLVIAPVLVLGFAPAALAQQSPRDLTAGSGDHMRSYGPAQNSQSQAAAPQAATTEATTPQPRARSYRTNSGRAAQMRTRNFRAATAPARGQTPSQTRNVSAQTAPTVQRRGPYDPSADHKR
jgi:hypothetical protein